MDSAEKAPNSIAKTTPNLIAPHACKVPGIAATHVGNIYINRNVIGAVVGVQHFGGKGLRGRTAAGGECGA